MSLIKRRPKVVEQPVVIEEEVELTTVEDLAAHLRDEIRNKVRCGMSTHETQDAQASLLRVVDEIDLTANPRKKA